MLNTLSRQQRGERVGVAQSVGLGSGTCALTLTGIGGIGAGAPAISAGMGQATSVGTWSVPSSWAEAAPSTSPGVAAMPFAGTGAVSAAHAPTAMPPMMPVANLAGLLPVDLSCVPPWFHISPAGG
jgi:PPE-repeat protein